MTCGLDRVLRRSHPSGVGIDSLHGIYIEVVECGAARLWIADVSAIHGEGGFHSALAVDGELRGEVGAPLASVMVPAASHSRVPKSRPLRGSSLIARLESCWAPVANWPVRAVRVSSPRSEGVTTTAGAAVCRSIISA